MYVITVNKFTFSVINFKETQLIHVYHFNVRHGMNISNDLTTNAKMI